MTQVVTRFAPSPTGFLHIGGARTALFNWLYARAKGGKFLLRIEDTDRARYSEEAVTAILDGLAWLGLDWDGDAISQHANLDRHAAVAHEMLQRGSAYKCYSTQDEIAAFRERARADGKSTLFLSPWRNVPEAEHPDLPFVIRLKTPHDGETVVEDAVQGRVAWKNDTLDDLILLRSDGTPTYMLAVVVDDHDMGVSHVIRGDDHLTNAARQCLIFKGMDWPEPVFAHIPLIHGEDGKKLSKRHGAVGVEEYRDAGYPPAALRNYLTRLGWSHGDDEFFTDDEARRWFDLDGIGKAAARFDTRKLANLSGQHINAMSDAELTNALAEYVALQNIFGGDDQKFQLLQASVPLLKERAKTLADMVDQIDFAFTPKPISYDEKAEKALDSVSRGILRQLTSRLQHANWSHDELDAILRDFATDQGLKFGAVASPLRAALTGKATSPGVFNVMEILGKEESLARLRDL